MKVFVAGASGAIGRPLVRQLIAAGHEVTGMTRRESAAEQIRGAGASAAVCDVFDAEALEKAVAAAAPEAVIHILTALPQEFNPRSDYLGPTNRVRTEGTRNLIAAARAAGARRLIAESVAFFYEPQGDWVKDEDAPLFHAPEGRFAAGLAALVELEREALDAPGMDGVVLRCGWLYGPGTYYDRGGSLAKETLRRRNPIVGAGTGTFSFIHVEDAAAAFVAALSGMPASTTSSTTIRRRCASGCRSMPTPSAPGRRDGFRLEMRGASNAKAKRELGCSRPTRAGSRGSPRPSGDLLASYGV